MMCSEVVFPLAVVLEDGLEDAGGAAVVTGVSSIAAASSHRLGMEADAVDGVEDLLLHA